MDPITRRRSPVIIPLDTHNVLDYVIGTALILSPYVFGFSDVNAARNVFLVLGFGLIGYSLITNYRYSVAKLIPLGMHMTFDVIAGLVLILSPTFFGYSPLLTGFQNTLHYVFGLGAWALVAFTSPKTNAAMLETRRVNEPPTDIRRAA